jgi:acyl-CoA reductase-like NAD-dependent aldehyde dehydrogenase
MITLTGGVKAGRRVLDYSKVNIAKSSLELGGKTPAIVAADADLEQQRAPSSAPRRRTAASCARRWNASMCTVPCTTRW